MTPVLWYRFDILRLEPKFFEHPTGELPSFRVEENPNPHFSPGGEAKCMRGLSVLGARRLTRGGVLGQYVEHGEQAQRSNGGPVMCLARQPVRNAG